MPRSALSLLPKFAGRSPEGLTLKVTGSSVVPEAMIEGHNLEDVVYVLSACRVSKVGHELDNDGHVLRIETLKAAKLAILDDTEGDKLLSRKFADAGVTFDI